MVVVVSVSAYLLRWSEFKSSLFSEMLFEENENKKKMIKTGHILNLFYSTQIVTNVWAGFKLGIVSVTSNNFVRVPSLLYKIIRYYFA